MNELMSELVGFEEWIQEAYDNNTKVMSYEAKQREQDLRIIKEKLHDIIEKFENKDFVDRDEIMESIKSSQDYYENEVKRFDYSAGFEKSIHIINIHNRKFDLIPVSKHCKLYNTEKCHIHEDNSCESCSYKPSTIHKEKGIIDTAYMVDIQIGDRMEAHMIIADNIAGATDKLEAMGFKKYEFIYSKSIPIIR